MVIFHVFGILFKRISIDAGHIIFFHSSSYEKKSVDYFSSPECDKRPFFGGKIAHFSNSMGSLAVGWAIMGMHENGTIEISAQNSTCYYVCSKIFR